LITIQKSDGAWAVGFQHLQNLVNVMEEVEINNLKEQESIRQAKNKEKREQQQKRENAMLEKLKQREMQQQETPKAGGQEKPTGGNEQARAQRVDAALNQLKFAKENV